jgi:hypothetical protein
LVNSLYGYASTLSDSRLPVQLFLQTAFLVEAIAECKRFNGAAVVESYRTAGTEDVGLLSGAGDIQQLGPCFSPT